MKKLVRIFCTKVKRKQIESIVFHTVGYYNYGYIYNEIRVKLFGLFWVRYDFYFNDVISRN